MRYLDIEGALADLVDQIMETPAGALLAGDRSCASICDSLIPLVQLLASVVKGEHNLDPATSEERALIEQAFGMLGSLLAGGLFLIHSAQAQQSHAQAWRDPMLAMWSLPVVGPWLGQVAKRLYGDEWISYTEAARLIWPDAEELSRTDQTNILTGRMRRLILQQRLQPYVDPDERNPRHAQRVRRSQVERYQRAIEQAPPSG